MKKSIITVMLAATLAAGTLGISGCSKVNMKNAPDYSDATGEFITYGYHSPVPASQYVSSDGDIFAEVYDENGNLIDFRTVEQYKMYKDCGLNTMFLQANDAYSGEPYETSQLKKNFQTARDAGIERVILCDSRIHLWNTDSKTGIHNTLSPYGKAETAEHKLVFDKIYGDKVYEKSFDDLVNVVKGWMKAYIHEDIFYGVMLLDEPKWQNLENVSAMHKAVTAAFPLAKAELEAEGVTVKAEDVFVQFNLLPYYESVKTEWYVDTSLPENAEISHKDAFAKYLKTYIDATNTKNITMDSYCIRQSGYGNTAEYWIESGHFAGLQTFAESTKDKDITMGGVSISTEISAGPPHTQVSYKAPSKSDMYYQLNSYMLFGFSSFSYYTYWAKTSSAETRRDGTMFINRDGTPTELYYFMTDIHAEMQAFAPVLTQFKYQQAKSYRSGRPSSTTYLTEFNEAESFAQLKNVELGDDQVVITTELYDAKKNQYMYAVMNTETPALAMSGTTGANVTLDFGKEFDAVRMDFRGKTYYLPLEKGKVTMDLSAGHAAFFMPF